MDSGVVDCGQGNPDISGIGVRLSFYLQNFLLVLLVDRSWEDAPSALWTFTSTSFGLTIAAVVQASQGQLSFFQALQVTNLVWLANFGSFLALASYSRHRTINSEEEKAWRHPDGQDTLHQQHVDAKPKPNNLVKMGAMTQMFFSMSLTLVTWARPDIFSNDSGDSRETCDVKYVAFFGASFPARGSGQVLGLTVTCLLLIGYLLITMHELRTYYTRNKRHEKQRAKKERERAKYALPVVTVTQAPTDTSVSVSNPALPSSTYLHPNHVPAADVPVHLNSESHPDERENRRHRRSSRMDDHFRARRANWQSDLDPMLLGLTIFQVTVFAYFIVCTELLLARNPISDNVDKQWGFGQILALIVVVPSFIAVVQAFREHKFGNLHHTKSKLKDRARHLKARSRSVSNTRYSGRSV